jgi:uncharacterized phage protein gp47/JayE
VTIGLPTSSKEVEDRVKVDVAREAPDSNPYVQNSWLLALVVGYGRRIFDFYRDLKRSEENTFPDTATGERAEQWGTIYGKTKTPATQSSGNCVATGIATTLIPAGTLLTANSLSYTVTTNATISAQVVNVTSITRSGTIATVTTSSSHKLASNVPVTIAGAIETEYNITDAVITVTGLDTFTYQVSGSPTTPATGTITSAFTSASVPVLSVEFGLQTNLSLDTPLTLQSPIAGVDDIMNTDYAEIGGGTDQEKDAAFKSRYLDRIQNPVSHFSVNDIISKAKEVPGVTRVFVEEAGTIIDTITTTSINRAGQVATVVTPSPHGLENHMQVTITGATEVEYNVIDARVLVVDTTTFVYIVSGSPATPATGGPVATSSIPLGVAQVYFTRDNDATSIPSASEVTTVKEKLDEIRPANTSENSLIVSAPTAVPVAFTFTDLSPNTLTMQEAIEANLAQFFEEATVVGQDIDEDAYRSAIKNTVDTQTGSTVDSFTLSTPTADVIIASGELGTLGTITI